MNKYYCSDGSAVSEEIWLPVNNWLHFYEVSNQGRLKRLRKEFFLNKKCTKPHVLAERISFGYVESTGYRVARLMDKKRVEDVKVHRLVAQAFIPNPDNKPCVNHINGIKTDNRVENLEWVTISENIKHASKLGLLKGALDAKGSKNNQSKLTEKDIPIIKNLYKQGITQTQIAERYKVTHSAISNIINNKSWTHV